MLEDEMKLSKLPQVLNMKNPAPVKPFVNNVEKVQKGGVSSRRNARMGSVLGLSMQMGKIMETIIQPRI